MNLCLHHPKIFKAHWSEDGDHALNCMGLENISGHDLRATGSTYLHGGYDSTHINLQMAHVDNTVSEIYNHALYLPERTKMLQDWADYLDEL